jgi:putative endonuclease
MRPEGSRFGPDDRPPAPGPWFVYLVRCADDTLYAGITTDVKRRVAEHNSDNGRGARYTRGRGPVTLAYFEPAGNRSEAARREHELKIMTRAEKLRLIEWQCRSR